MVCGARVTVRIIASLLYAASQPSPQRVSCCGDVIAQRRRVCRCCVRPCCDDQVTGWQGAAATQRGHKRIQASALPVAPGGAADRLARHHAGAAKRCLRCASDSPDTDKSAAHGRAALPESVEILCTKPLRSLQHRSGEVSGDRQACPAACAPARNNLRTARSLHARQETVLALALADLRLICAFCGHRSIPRYPGSVAAKGDSCQISPMRAFGGWIWYASRI